MLRDCRSGLTCIKTVPCLQVKYVVELARALAQHPAVYRVDLLTRLIKDPKVDSSYGVPEECIMPSEGSLGGAYIIRLPCGPADVYLRYVVASHRTPRSVAESNHIFRSGYASPQISQSRFVETQSNKRVPHWVFGTTHSHPQWGTGTTKAGDT